MEPARPEEVAARYSEDRRVVFLSSAAHAFELRLSTQGARALFFALGRLFFAVGGYVMLEKELREPDLYDLPF